MTNQSRKPIPLIVAVAFAVIAALCCVGALTLNSISGDRSASESVAPIVVPETTSAPTTAAAVRSWNDGTWAVGSDIKPGTYVTTAREDGCYWARVKDFEGSLDSIIANGNLDKGAHGRVTIKKTDKGVEFSGGCVWVKG